MDSKLFVTFTILVLMAIVGNTVADDEDCNVEDCTKDCKRLIQPNATGICQGKVCTCNSPCDPKADMCGRTCMVSGKGRGHCDPKTLDCICDNK